MIHSEPPITRTTISTPNASAITLLVLSGPVVMCRKNTRCTPICAIASTTSATGMLGAQTRSVPAIKKDARSAAIASAKPDQIAQHALARRCAVGARRRARRRLDDADVCVRSCAQLPSDRRP